MKTFSEKVVEIARSIPSGRVTTYGRIARAAGAGPIAAQSITTILSKAYKNGVTDIPWHRVVYADGHIWVSPKHRKERMALYKRENIGIDKKDRVQNFRDILIEFN